MRSYHHLLASRRCLEIAQGVVYPNVFEMKIQKFHKNSMEVKENGVETDVFQATIKVDS